METVQRDKTCTAKLITKCWFCGIKKGPIKLKMLNQEHFLEIFTLNSERIWKQRNFIAMYDMGRNFVELIKKSATIALQKGVMRKNIIFALKVWDHTSGFTSGNRSFATEFYI